MSENFYTILTSTGKAKIANSAVIGSKVNFKTLKVGDGKGSYYEPTENQTSLVNEVWTGAITSISIDESNPTWIVVETLIPATIGGFFIREAGIFDEDGDLIAISKLSETYKPVVSEGSTKDLCIRIILEVNNVDSVTLKLDPTVIVATKKDVQTLESEIKDVSTQLSDFVYQTAGGTGTALTITIKGTLVNGYPITFIASANNGAAATAINGKKLYKSGTTTAPNLITGKAYTIWYSSTGDCFFIKASAEGDAVVANVLAGKKFSNDDDTGLTGTMPNRAGDTVCMASSISGTTLKLRASEGYRDGVDDNVTITDANFLAGNIVGGKSIFGLVGSYDPMLFVPGTAYMLYNPGSQTQPYTGDTAAYTEFFHAIISNQGGTVRVQHTAKADLLTDGTTMYTRIYVNGVARGIEHITTGYTSITYTEDITINAGDRVSLYCRGTRASSRCMTLSNFKIMCDNLFPLVTQ